MKKFLGYFLLVVAIVPVAMFLGIHEIAFFTNTFAADNQAMAPLGYMLTGGGVFVWIGIFLWNAKSAMQKAISFIMIMVCVIGALGAALFNIYTVTMTDGGFTLSKSDIQAATLLVGVLAIIHMLALIAELAGEQIIQALDADGDGVLDVFQGGKNRNQNKNQNQQNQNHPQNQPMHSNASDTELVQLRKENARLKAEKAGTDPNTPAGQQNK